MSIVAGVREQDQVKGSDIALLQSQVLIQDENDLKLENLKPQAILGTSRWVLSSLPNRLSTVSSAAPDGLVKMGKV